MKTKLLLLFFCSLLILAFWLITTLPDRRMHLVFCNVGQGDAAYIRAPNGVEILIDGGPDGRVLDCLQKNMAFYDRTIDLLILSHPQTDHLTGLIEVVKRYNVKQVIDASATSNTEIDKLWRKILSDRKIKRFRAEIGQRIRIDAHFSLDILWPERTSRDSKLQFDIDVNLLSTVVLLKYRDFSALFTGDIDREIFKQLLTANRQKLTAALTVLKVPHHGSKDGLDGEILNILKPKTAVISVGKNSFGHPSKELIKILESAGTKILRTDMGNDIQIQPNP